jgi:hypothetical protein
MNKSRLAATAALISLSISSAAQASCWLPEERDAAQVRALQTMLMVGTLHCRGRDGYIAAAYDRFVSKHRALLDEQNGVLQAHFARENRENARAAYDRYNTAVANQYAQHDFGSEDLCWSIASLAEQAEDTDSRDLLSLAGDHTLPPSDASCRPTKALARPARPTLPAIKAAPEPVEPVQVPVTVAEAEPEPVVAPAPAVQVAAARTGAPEQPAQSREDALKLAIAALQAATAALEAAAETPEMPAVPAGEVSKIDLLEGGGPGNK